ncbi:MAG: TolC family protein [Planctomycetia bacterium]|nr:TolC family protein [Planctomycetia bacterium]
MKRLLALLVVAGCATPHGDDAAYLPAGRPRREPAPATGPMTLEACVREALGQSRALRMADRRALIERDRADDALAALLPHLKAEGRYEVRNNDPGAVFGGAPVVAGERRVASGSVTALVPVWDFGVTVNAMEAARREGDRAGHEAKDARLRAEREVVLAYVRVLEARGIVRVVEESLKAVGRQAEAAREARLHGLAAANDVVAAEAQEAERRQQLLSARNNATFAEALLNRLMGRDLRTPVEIEDPGDAPPRGGDYDADLDEALARRPDLAAMRSGIEASQARWRSTRDGFFPRVWLYGSANGTTDDFVLHKAWLSGGVGIQIPLFDGGATIAGARRSEREVDQAVDRHAEGVDDAALSVLKARLDVGEAEAQVPVSLKAVELATENLRVTKDMYAQGVATGTDVLVEEDRLARALAAALRARYAVHAAHARLRFETGHSLLEEDR